MCNSTTCPGCSQTVSTINDLVSCRNKDCLEFDIKYYQYEFNDMCTDLIDMNLMQEDAINEPLSDN